MRRRFLKFMKRAVVGGLAVWILLSPGGGYAAGSETSIPLSGSITIAAPLIITQETALNFGRIQRPASGSQQFLLNLIGDPSTTGTGKFIDGQVLGVFAFVGSSGQSVNLTATSLNDETPCGGGSGGVLLTTVTPQSTFFALPLDNWKIGGIILVPSTAGGVSTCSYTLTLTYQ